MWLGRELCGIWVSDEEQKDVISTLIQNHQGERWKWKMKD